VSDPTSVGHSGLFGFGVADTMGSLGVTLYIGAYLALQLGLIRGNGYLYPALNLVAGAAVLFSLMDMFNRYSALTQIAWITISVIGIVRMYLVRRFLRLHPEEEKAANALIPLLARDRARRFLKNGEWRSGEAGEVLAREGEPLNALIYIADGRCRIERDGVPVAVSGPGGIIGEMTFRSGQAATATVVAETPTRRLHFEAAPLRRFLARNEDVGHALELSISADLRGKLASTTRRLAKGRPSAETAGERD
jgi:CRP-like cAMP-binding protein